MTATPDHDPIPFTPVLLKRVHRRGWTPERQRRFIDALALCGSVSLAARSVGLTARSAYALLAKDEADSFADAWDTAVVMGREFVLGAVIDRAIHGGWVPITRGGRVTGKRWKYFDSLAGNLLMGKAGQDVFDQQQDRRERRDYARRVKKTKADHEAQKAREEADRVALAAETARQLADYARRAALPPEPRVRQA